MAYSAWLHVVVIHSVFWRKKEGKLFKKNSSTFSLYVNALLLDLQITKKQQDKQPVASDLRLLLGELHVVKDAEDDSEEVVPPVLLEGVAITLHDLKHDRETSVRGKDKTVQTSDLKLSSQQEESGHSVRKLPQQCQ